jgi:uncharacterized surface protein with fasciclin (FAS1) repeats
MNKLTRMMVVPFVLTAAAACGTNDPMEAQTQNIVEVAVSAGSFTTLVAAVEAAGLVNTLQGDGPFTVFAPTDAAFAQLPAGTVEALLGDIPTLTAILTYHVVPGRVTSAEILRAGNAQPVTVEGRTLNVQVVNGVVRVNGAAVTTADIGASNGVIHVIDSVLLPPEGT